MSATVSNALLVPTLDTVLNNTSLFSSLAYSDSSSVQTITFGILSTVLAVGSIVLAYLQLARIRKARLRDAELDCEMH
jgi:hypothetical protein